MKLSSICASSLLFLASTAGPVLAQTTDAATQVSAALKTFGPVPITTTAQVPRTQQVCDYKEPPSHGPGRSGSTAVAASLVNCHSETVYDPKTQTVNQLLTASNIRVVQSAPISWGQITNTDLPNLVFPDTSMAQNCQNASAPLTFGYSLSVAYTRQSAIQISQSVTHTQNFTASFDTGSLLPFKVGAQVSVGGQTTNGTTTVETTQQTVTRTHNDSVQVPIGAVSVVQMRVWPIQYTLPFITSVTVDADLSPNDKGLKLLSDILPDPVSRTFVVSGTLSANDASAGQTVGMTAPYNPSLCTSTQTSYIGPHFVPSSKMKLTRMQNK